MKKIVLLALGFFILVSSVSAYQVYIYAPDTLTVGKPLVVNGTTTFGIGTPIDVVLYQQVTTSTEIKRVVAYVQSDKTFRVVFDTTLLPVGLYKVEVPSGGTGDSITMRQVNLVDRSDEIVLTSQMTQTLSGKVNIDGKITVDTNTGVQIVVIGPDNSVIYGPQYVNTDSLGEFNVAVPISQTGDYEVSFTDAEGYIGSRTISIIGGHETISTESPSTGSPSTESPSTETPVTTPAQISAQGKSSRDNPAYFIVRPSGSGPVTVSTSTSVDWVVEYTDENGDLHTVNDQGESAPEVVVVNGADKPLYFKVYPYKYSVSEVVTLYVDNVDSIEVSPTVPPAFSGGLSPVSSAVTKKSPLVGTCSLIAVCLAALFIHLRRH
jgi:hypothetical protein